MSIGTIEESILEHTCTIERPTTSLNAVGQTVFTWPGTPLATAVICFFDDQPDEESEDRQQMEVSHGKLYLDPDQDIAMDDRVSTIKRADLTTVQAGPYKVISIAEPGSQFHHREVKLQRVS